MTDQHKTVNINIRQDLFGANEDAASLNADLFKKHGITVIDIMGSVGTGKTQLIEAMCERLHERHNSHGSWRPCDKY